MSLIQCVMRVVTHVSIGATLGLVAWLAWASLQVASGAQPVPRHPPVDGVPTRHQPVNLPCCLVPGISDGPGLQAVHAPPVQQIAAAAVRP